MLRVDRSARAAFSARPPPGCRVLTGTVSWPNWVPGGGTEFLDAQMNSLEPSKSK